MTKRLAYSKFICEYYVWFFFQILSLNGLEGNVYWVKHSSFGADILENDNIKEEVANTVFSESHNRYRCTKRRVYRRKILKTYSIEDKSEFAEDKKMDQELVSF